MRYWQQLNLLQEKNLAVDIYIVYFKPMHFAYAQNAIPRPIFQMYKPIHLAIKCLYAWQRRIQLMRLFSTNILKIIVLFTRRQDARIHMFSTIKRNSPKHRAWCRVRRNCTECAGVPSRPIVRVETALRSGTNGCIARTRSVLRNHRTTFVVLCVHVLCGSIYRCSSGEVYFLD